MPTEIKHEGKQKSNAPKNYLYREAWVMSRNSLVDLFSEANIVYTINLSSWKNNISRKISL